MAVSVEEIDQLVKLDEGAFGVVYRGLWKRKLAESIVVAIKTLKELDKIEELSKEKIIMEKIVHKNIVRFFGIYDIQVDSNITKAILLELMTEGSVKDFLEKRTKHSIKPLEILSIAIDAATGMRYLHENDIIHRDLAARNLLLTKENGQLIVKVSDFGLAREVPSDSPGRNDYYVVKTSKNPIRWTAPELFLKGHVSTRSDLWSFGVVLYELFTLCKLEPYVAWSNHTVIQKIKSGEKMYEYLPIPNGPKAIQALLNQCLNNNSHARPDFDKMVALLKEIKETLKDNNAWDDLSDEEDNDNNNNRPIITGFIRTGNYYEVVTENRLTLPAKLAHNISLESQSKHLPEKASGQNDNTVNSFLPSFEARKMQTNSNPVSNLAIPSVLMVHSPSYVISPDFPFESNENEKAQKTTRTQSGEKQATENISTTPSRTTSFFLDEGTKRQGLSSNNNNLEEDADFPKSDYPKEEDEFPKPDYPTKEPYYDIDTSKFDAMAKQWFEGAKQDNTDDQCNLGFCYYRGTHGVLQDYKAALFWFQKSGRKNAEAQNMMGRCYQEGEKRGAPKADILQAMEWYEKAAKQGLSSAQFNLGACYHKKAAAKDCQESQKTQYFQKAIYWYTQAAEQRHGDACLQLGILYKKGWGTLINNDMALKYFEKAKEYGNKDADAKIAEFKTTQGSRFSP